MKLRSVWYHDVPFTAAERAAYGQRMQAQREAAARRAAEDARLADLLDPTKGAAGYCISFATGEAKDCGEGCPWCDRARTEGVTL